MGVDHDIKAFVDVNKEKINSKKKFKYVYW